MRHENDSLDLGDINALAMAAKRHETNRDIIVPTGIAAMIAGGLSLTQVILFPAAPAGSLAWYSFVILFSTLLACGVLLILLHRFALTRPILPIASTIAVSVLSAGLAATDFLVSGDLSALIIGLVGGSITLRTRMPFHFLRGLSTIALYVVFARLLSGTFPGAGNLINALVDLTLAMLVAFVLERYADRSFLLQCELESRNRELEEISFRDRLTGLYNRHFLDETLERTLALAKRGGIPSSLIMLDIDHFKAINDLFGHDEGDRVLVAVTDAIARCVRNSDTVGRFGGEEFIVILPETPLKGACLVAARILETVRGLDAGSVPRPMTISAGVAEMEKDEDAKQLAKRVDRLLYKAKGKGRDRLEC